MGKTIRVTPEQLAEASTKLAGISQSYKQIYSQLMQEASTMGAAWEGADNMAFVNRITGFTDDLKLMADKLMTASQGLEQQRANYVNRQQDNISRVNTLTN